MVGIKAFSFQFHFEQLQKKLPVDGLVFSQIFHYIGFEGK